MDKSSWLKAVRSIHGNRFDYSEVPDTFGWNDRVPVICRKHGRLLLSAHNHKHGLQCVHCTRANQFSTAEAFIKKARAIHGKKYDYSRVVYKGNQVKIRIKCPLHGWFEQQPNNHLMGRGCHLCGDLKTGEKLRKNLEDFVQEARSVHGNKYGYNKVNYTNTDTDVLIECPRHGVFKQRPKHHLSGSGCPLCMSAKEYKFGRRTMLLQGYEPHAVDWIRSNTGVSLSELFESKHPKADKRPPTFRYEAPDGAIRTYHPDFWIPARKIVVEVKSEWTRGVKGSQWNAVLLAKKRAVRDAGFKFRLLVLDGNGNLVSTKV